MELCNFFYCIIFATCSEHSNLLLQQFPCKEDMEEDSVLLLFLLLLLLLLLSLQ